MKFEDLFGQIPMIGMMSPQNTDAALFARDTRCMMMLTFLNDQDVGSFGARDTRVVICGPPVMFRFVTRELDKLGVKAFAVRADIATDAECRRLVQELISAVHEFGPRSLGFQALGPEIRDWEVQSGKFFTQEDVDGIGLSILSGAHNYLFPKVLELLKEKKMEDVVVFGGGIIPDDDIPKLLKKGVDRVFTPGTPIQQIVDYVNERIRPRK
jgi:methylmalonyl-CoA mutase C-terminal domain/subunit